MHDLPRQKLCELLAKHGSTLCDDARRLEGLLKDVLHNEHKRETFVLISALREGVAHEFRWSTSGIPPAALAVKLMRQLCDNLALDEAAAQWSVESWAVALCIEIRQPLQSPRYDMRQLLEMLPGETGLPWELKNSIGMKFVLIQSGSFMMGSNTNENEKPQHVVKITRPFYISVFPVTQSEYQAVIGTNPSHFTGNNQLPVEMIDWHDAVSFCERLNQSTIEVERGAHYRLPKEAEWEYACRAGSSTKWCFGDNESLLGDYAWFDENSGKRTHPVGEKEPNYWGLYDLHGNVWEWCLDVFDGEAYMDRSGITQDPFVVSGNNPVARGGSWDSSDRRCRSASRAWGDPSHGDNIQGFRVAMSLHGQ